MLISVDAWSVACEEDPAQPRVNQAEHDRHYANACNRLAPFGERSEVWRCESTAAAAQLPPRSLDFVYIDARHDYEAVAADIAAWIDRVRPGGLFAGHDYFDGQYQGAFYGVKRAVDEFCADRGLRVATTWREPVEMRSWLVLIPERWSGLTTHGPR